MFKKLRWKLIKFKVKKIKHKCDKCCIYMFCIRKPQDCYGPHKSWYTEE